MIAYFDTSAVVPLLITEPGSARTATLWNGADRVVSVRLLYVVVFAGDGAPLDTAAAEGLTFAALP